MTAAPRLPAAQWLEVVERAPLVSIDLILRDAQGRVLLGYRSNRPAQHSWFVPGGVICKDESLDTAFARIARAELGITAQRSQARLLGVYEHFYTDNFLGSPAVGTHYVVLAYELMLPALPATAADDQHSALRAWTVAQLLDAADVHPNTKAYFTAAP